MDDRRGRAGRGPDRGAALRLPGGLGARRGARIGVARRGSRPQRPEADGRHVRGRGRRRTDPGPAPPVARRAADHGRHRRAPGRGRRRDRVRARGHPRAPAPGADVVHARPGRRDARLRHERLGQVHAAAHHRHRGGTASRPRGGAGVRARLRRRRAPVARVAPARRRGHRGRRRGARAAAAAHPRRPPRPARPGVQRGECGEPHRVPPDHRPPRAARHPPARRLRPVQGRVGHDDGADAPLQRLHADPRRGPTRSACTWSPPPIAPARSRRR